MHVVAEPAEAGEGFRKEIAGEKQLLVEHGKPLVFGKDRKRGLRMKSGTIELEAVAISTAFAAQPHLDRQRQARQNGRLAIFKS